MSVTSKLRYSAYSPQHAVEERRRKSLCHFIMLCGEVGTVRFRRQANSPTNKKQRNRFTRALWAKALMLSFAMQLKEKEGSPAESRKLRMALLSRRAAFCNSKRCGGVGEGGSKRSCALSAQRRENGERAFARNASVNQHHLLSFAGEFAVLTGRTVITSLLKAHEANGSSLLPLPLTTRCRYHTPPKQTCSSHPASRQKRGYLNRHFLTLEIASVSFTLMERTTRLELATPTLARSCSTN